MSMQATASSSTGGKSTHKEFSKALDGLGDTASLTLFFFVWVNHNRFNGVEAWRGLVPPLTGVGRTGFPTECSDPGRIPCKPGRRGPEEVLNAYGF